MIYDQSLTLDALRQHQADDPMRYFSPGWLDEYAGGDGHVTIAEIYRNNGFLTALWCLKALTDDRLSRHFRAWCAARVLPIYEAAHPGDTRVRDQIAMLRRDDANDDDRSAAREAARSAAKHAALNSTMMESWVAALAASGLGEMHGRSFPPADALTAAVLASDAKAWDFCGSDDWDDEETAKVVEIERAAQERHFRKLIGVQP